MSEVIFTKLIVAALLSTVEMETYLSLAKLRPSGPNFMSKCWKMRVYCVLCVSWVGERAASLLRVLHLRGRAYAPDIWWRGWLSLNQERRGTGLPSASHSILRDSVTFTVWLVRLRL